MELGLLPGKVAGSVSAMAKNRVIYLVFTANYL